MYGTWHDTFLQVLPVPLQIRPTLVKYRSPAEAQSNIGHNFLKRISQKNCLKIIFILLSITISASVDFTIGKSLLTINLNPPLPLIRTANWNLQNPQKTNRNMISKLSYIIPGFYSSSEQRNSWHCLTHCLILDIYFLICAPALGILR